MRTLRWVLACAAIQASSVVTTVADDLTGYVEHSYTVFDTRFRLPDEAPVDTSNRTFLQRYSLTYMKTLLPNLWFQAGGLFQRDASRFETGDLESRGTVRTLRPFLDIRLDTDRVRAEVAYNRNEQIFRSPGLRTSGNVRETYSATLGWFPDTLPSAKLQFFRTNAFDRNRLFEDTTDDRLQLTSEYRPIDSLYLYYKGTAQDTKDRVHDNTIDRLIQTGRVTYYDAWWANRIQLSSDYNVQHRTVETKTSGAGEILFPLSPTGGLSAIDDTPEDGPLDPNPALIDGSLTAGAGIDLGLPPPSGDDRPRNIGLDLASETDVNTLFVWVDRDLRPEIAGSFTWKIYTSSDNRTWSLRTPPSSTSFGPFLTRFEIRFEDVIARYVKVVVKPLSPTVPFASDFPIILVTEIEAARRRPAAEVRGRRSETAHLYNLDLRVQILGTPTLVYELTYFLTKTSRGPTIDTVSNGLSLRHSLWGTLNAAARVAHEDGRTREGHRHAFLYTGSLAAEPAPTLRTSVVFSGTNEEIEGRSNDLESVFLYGTAELYPGLDANLGVGKSYTTPETGDRTRSTYVNGGATLVPQRTMTVNLFFTDKTDVLTDRFADRSTLVTRTGETSVAYRPLSALYLFGSYRLEQRTGQDRRSINDYAINWSPFPDGTLRLSFSYNEVLRSEDDSKETTITPSVRWSLSNRCYLEASYQKLKTDSVVQQTDTDILTGTFRLTF